MRKIPCERATEYIVVNLTTYECGPWLLSQWNTYGTALWLWSHPSIPISGKKLLSSP